MKPTAARRRFLIWRCRTSFPAGHTHTDPPAGATNSNPEPAIFLFTSMSDLADTNPGGWVDHDGAPLTLRCGPSLWQPLRGRTRLPSLTHSPRQSFSASTATPCHPGTPILKEEVMNSLLALVSLLLLFFELVLIARVALDWIGALAAPSGRAAPLSGVRTAVHRATEPVLAPVRRVLPPLRMGGISLDLAVTAVLLAIIVVRSVLP